jgi:Domain of unknown function (DUF4193)
MMTIDYDAVRVSEIDEPADDTLLHLATGRDKKDSGAFDAEDADAPETFELPGLDMTGQELFVRVIPQRADEFTCSVCFLVHHRSQLASVSGKQTICTECAA